jgi:hypothetical protein
MNFIKKNWEKAVLLTYVLVSPVSCLYADTPGTIPSQSSGSGMIVNPLGSGTSSVPALIQTFLTGALKIGIPIVALAIIYCGFLFVFARGNSEKLTKAKDALLYTIIGAAVLLGAWAIATMISATVLAL